MNEFYIGHRRRKGNTLRIKDVSERVGASTRLLRYYEEQGLLTPRREENGYRYYDEESVARVQQIRGLIEAGLTTEIIREVLPCLAAASCSQYSDPEFLARVVHERDRLQERVDVLAQNVKALDDYLDAAAKDHPASEAA